MTHGAYGTPRTHGAPGTFGINSIKKIINRIAIKNNSRILLNKKKYE